jgi:hypothetical protein
MSAVTGEQQVINDFEIYIRQHGGGYSAWYCGVAADPKSRLFNDHNVDKNGAWIHSGDTGSDDVARNIEDYFLSKGCKGGGGGGDSGTRYVYAYKITSTTRE